ncbi:DUF1697 domain-containing protein [Paenibacillus flagellatus]|uniref:Cytoplasmic protein n=1 Tax=Paenibacillus flagellatus TaxID=2211139 RepID=A0A2V5KA12_9BACL|nr:DUF1697 domain-containing protein [Paenibacillus flagellatus]PYI55732.1 hypothetical protein DLM86_08400 [Paenibacillus flagellatus]
MNRYVALLRGINVSGQKPIKMADLKRMFEEMGFARVQTYIQSGNVLFEAEGEAETIRREIERGIEESFGFEVTVVLRTTADMERVVRSCPFPADALKEGESLYVSLLADTPSPQAIDKLPGYSDDIDEYRIAGRDVYILCRKGFGQSKFSNSFLERKLGVAATNRNWQTMTKLVALGRAMENG